MGVIRALGSVSLCIERASGSVQGFDRGGPTVHFSGFRFRGFRFRGLGV